MLLRGFPLAFAAWGAAFVLRWVLNPWLGDHQPWFTFYPAIAVIAWRFGWLSSAITALLGLGSGIVFLLPPRGDLALRFIYSWVQVFTYLGVASAFVVLLGRARTRRIRNEQSKAVLEHDLRLLDLGNGLVMDMQERVTRWNTGTQRLYGFTREQALGRNVHELLQTQFPVPLEEVRNQLLARNRWAGELVQRRADGLQVVVASEWVLQRNDTGQALAILEVNTDITRRKEAESALADQNRRLTLLTEAATKLLSTEDTDLALTGLYKRIGEFLQTSAFFEFELSESGDGLNLRSCWAEGMPRADCGLTHLRLGQGIVGRVAETRRPLVRCRIQESNRADEEFIRPHGVHAYACFPLLVGQRLLGTLSFASCQVQVFSEADLQFFSTLASYTALAKERRRLTLQLQRHAAGLEEAVLERTAEMRQMSYSMVHEMRAPLRAIICFSECLLEEAGANLQPQTRNYLSRIQASAARMDRLVNDTLNFNKVLTERHALEPVDAGRVLSDLLDNIEQFQPPHATVQVEGHLPKVLASYGLLSQCFSQLLRNAIQYVQPGRQPRVEVSAQRAQNIVRFCFRDNGVGIPPELQSRVFELFERGVQEVSGGTGAGLALVRKMVERMHGRVSVESAPGHGSRFSIELPAAA